MKSTREEVYAAIDGERAYQDSRWNPATTPSGGVHTNTEWLVYIRDYVEEAMHVTSRFSDYESGDRVAAIMRKIAAMSVAAMEQNGASPRVVRLEAKVSAEPVVGEKMYFKNELGT